MLMLVFLKIVADLALYFTFAGFFAAVYGASAVFIFGCLLAATVTFCGVYLLKDRGWLRFVPVMFLAVLCLTGVMTASGILEGNAGLQGMAQLWKRWLPEEMMATAGYVVMIPALAYMGYLTAKEVYEPDRYSQMGIFSAFWKVYLGFCLFMIIAGKSGEVTAVSVPMGVLTLAASVLILRSLRHEPEVYLQRKYQLTNLLLVAGVVGLVLLLSSDIMVIFVVTAVKTIYQWVVLPVIMLAVYIFAIILWLLSKIFSFIKFKKPEKGESTQMQIMNVNQIFEEIVPGANHEELFAKILLGICIVAALIVCILVFSRLAQREKGSSEISQVRDERSRTAVKREKKRQQANTYVDKVREQYKGFLRMLASHGIVPGISDTSLDVQKQYCMVERSAEGDGKLADELRQIYIAARYDGEAGKEEVQRARELCAEIKKIVEN